MKPWSALDPGDERIERYLFARRARSLDAVDVPPLSTVLRAADAERGRPWVGERAWAALAFAACMAAAWTRLPSLAVSGPVISDADAGASVGGSTTSWSAAAGLVGDQAICEVPSGYSSAEVPACIDEQASLMTRDLPRTPLSSESEPLCSSATP